MRERRICSGGTDIVRASARWMTIFHEDLAQAHLRRGELDQAEAGCVLASPDADWRWRSWYPNVALCTQEEAGSWASAVAQALEVIQAEMMRAGEDVGPGRRIAA